MLNLLVIIYILLLYMVVKNSVYSYIVVFRTNNKIKKTKLRLKSFIHSFTQFIIKHLFRRD